MPICSRVWHAIVLVRHCGYNDRIVAAAAEGGAFVLKSIVPIWGKLHNLQRPSMFVHPTHEADDAKMGQRMAESVAAAIGSWPFIAAQASAMAVWVLINTLAFTHVIHFDGYPFVFLNLAMSAEAAFTGPILLIAANVGAARDHIQSNRIEHLVAQDTQLAETNEKLVEQLANIEQMIDLHVAQSMAAHSAEIRAVYNLMREVHAHVAHNAALSEDCELPAPIVGAPAFDGTGEGGEAVTTRTLMGGSDAR